MLDAECRCVLHSKINRSTSALGQKQTSGHDRLMSALPPIADITESDWDVRFVPNGDISNGFTRVCFEGFEPIRAIGIQRRECWKSRAGNKVANQGLKVATLLGYGSRKLGAPAGGKRIR
jgi:hypothetical protein